MKGTKSITTDGGLRASTEAPKSVGISRDLWLKALQDAGLHEDDDPHATTVDEFMAMFGLKRAAAVRKLEELAAKGKARRTHKRQATPHGKTVSYVAYRLES